MNRLVEELLRRLGNLCYTLNGGLDHLNNESTLDRMAIWFWATAYGIGVKK